MSLSELSELAGVARYTLIRIEQGRPCQPATLEKVRKALHLFTDQMTRPFPDGSFAVHRTENTRWSVAHAKHSYQKQIDEDSRIHVNDPEERRRLGQLGFQPFFTAILDSEVTNGVSSQAIMEFYRPSWVDTHFGEEFVYCLRGSVTITVDGVPCVLREGDAMTFDATLPHQYAPTEDVELLNEPPQILIVVSRRAGEHIPRHNR
jgi:mannose-6-phosphate isomerase-like protein (cupin superfamily)